MNLPPRIHTPASWTGPQMLVQPETWTWTLSPTEIEDLERAADDYLAAGYPLENITKSVFPLPVTGARLGKMRHQLVNGCGYCLLRGLDVSRYNRGEIATLFMGLGAHLGSARSQNAAGHLLGHVRNVGADANDPTVRIYQTNERQTFHTDSCDVVGLMCLQTAKSGGESLLVSTESIYNTMRTERPDLISLLFDPVATDKRGEVEPGTEPYFTIPVWSWYAGKLSVIYQRQYIDSAQRHDSAPELTDKHVEALDMFDALSNDVRLNLSMKLAPGDLQFVHNHSMLHDRAAYVDWPEPERRRHLLRLWLSVPGDRPLPPVFKQRYGSTEIGNRGGVIVEGTQRQAPLD